ncbi:MAG: hypothetical protein AB1Z98_24715 [Nannocystaceae bacterium]
MCRANDDRTPADHRWVCAAQHGDWHLGMLLELVAGLFGLRDQLAGIGGQLVLLGCVVVAIRSDFERPQLRPKAEQHRKHQRGGEPDPRDQARSGDQCRPRALEPECPSLRRTRDAWVAELRGTEHG